MCENREIGGQARSVLITAKGWRGKGGAAQMAEPGQRVDGVSTSRTCSQSDADDTSSHVLKMFEHEDREDHVYSISRLPENCTWGIKNELDEPIDRYLTEANKSDIVTVWTVAQLKSWYLEDGLDKFNIGFLPLRTIDHTACNDWLKRLTTGEL